MRVEPFGSLWFPLHHLPEFSDESCVTPSKALDVDLRSEGSTVVLSPREAWALGRPVVWLVPLLFATLAVAVPLGFRLAANDAVDRLLFIGAAHNLGLFLGQALTGFVLVAVGWRRLWMAPVLLFVFLPELPHLINLVLVGDWSEFADVMGFGWGPMTALGRFGGPILLVLLLTPGFWLRYKSNLRSSHRRISQAKAASLGIMMLVVGMVIYVRMVLAPYDPHLLDQLIEFAPLVVFGASLGTAKGWWPWAHLAIGVLAVGPLAWVNEFGYAEYYLPLAIAALVAALWRPLARLIGTSDQGPFVTLVLLNVLNVADAALTQWALAAGQATELNPFVTTFGMPIKLVLVAAASILIYRLRPKALIWPTLALGAVAVWHVIGLIVNS